MRWFTRALIVGVLWLPAIPTAAQTKDPHALSAGRKLAAEGDKAWAAQDYNKAFDRFSRAYDLVKAPALAVRKAECLLKLGRLVEASEAYMQIVRVELPPDAPSVSRQAVETARRESAALRARLPTVSIAVDGLHLEGATLTVDGKELPRALWGTKFPVDPGTHRVEVVKGARRVSEEVTISEREAKELSLLLPGGEGEPPPPPATETLSPPPPPTGAPTGQPPPVAAESPTPSSQRTWGWVSLGIGGAGVALGGITGAMVLSKRSSLDENCVDGVCPVSRQSDVDSYNTMRTVSVIGFGVGLAGAATGLVLLLTARDEPAGVATNGSVRGAAPSLAPSLPAGVRPWLGAGAAGLEGEILMLGRLCCMFIAASASGCLAPAYEVSTEIGEGGSGGTGPGAPVCTDPGADGLAPPPTTCAPQSAIASAPMKGVPGGYCIDVTEVTVAEYREWLVTAPTPADLGLTECAWNDNLEPANWAIQLGGDTTLPVVNVDWCDAVGYCDGVGKRLCGKIGGGENLLSDAFAHSRSEWHNACTSGCEHPYPYGSTYDPSACNVSATATIAPGTNTLCRSTVPGYEGILDLVGNVSEWENSCQKTINSGSDLCRTRGPGFQLDDTCSFASETRRDSSLDWVGIRCCL